MQITYSVKTGNQGTSNEMNKKVQNESKATHWTVWIYNDKRVLSQITSVLLARTLHKKYTIRKHRNLIPITMQLQLRGQSCWQGLQRGRIGVLVNKLIYFIDEKLLSDKETPWNRGENFGLGLKQTFWFISFGPMCTCSHNVLPRTGLNPTIILRGSQYGATTAESLAATPLGRRGRERRKVCVNPDAW